MQITLTAYMGIASLSMQLSKRFGSHDMVTLGHPQHKAQAALWVTNGCTSVSK